MSKFKVGDRVRCVSTGHNTLIKVGQEYHILIAHNNGYVVINNNSSHEYHESRFVLVSSPPPSPLQLNKWYPIHQLPSSFERGTSIGYLTSEEKYSNAPRSDDLAFRILSFPKKKVEKKVEGFGVFLEGTSLHSAHCTRNGAVTRAANCNIAVNSETIRPCTITYTIEE